ncbi:MAG TPA: YciI family protein [Thermoplasmata archaeon]|nr:YciI family protein [Thermoplasmata archaeon]
MTLFAVLNEQGPNWDGRRPMREQDGWTEHAAFMDALTADRIVVLGGPLRGGTGHRALLVLRADDESALRARLAEDPWMRSGVLRGGELLVWELLLGELP